MATKKATTKKTTTKKKSLQQKAIEKQAAEQEKSITFTIDNGEEARKKAAEILANEYFNGVKTKAEYLTDENIQKELEYLPAQIKDLEMVGQIGLANKLKKMIKNLVSERILLANGFNKYVHRKDITRYVELVKDKKVHVCELDKFPRLIPEAAKKLLMKAKELDVFSDFWVVYVDYSDDGDAILTEKEKKERAKNRDPIIFGTFDSPETGTLDKLYFICDWIDEYCDLTLDKMIKELVKDDADYKPSIIVKDINKYINNVLMELSSKEKKETFTDKVKKLFGLKK